MKRLLSTATAAAVAAARRLRSARTTAGAVALHNLPDALLLSGAASVSYGAWMIYQPAGFITGGLLLLVAGCLASLAD